MRELYELTWPGKHEAVLEAGKPTDKTLRPCPEQSRNFETTQNLYIEGDNLDALKILQKSYMKRVKLIYIDPPYNTGHDFIYRDDFSQSESESQQEFLLFDDKGSRNFTLRNYRENSRSNPRFHSDWLSMIYPRLKLARNLLSDDGVIFISIDDNEAANLRKICDEIFGESNFVAMFIWQNKKGGGNDAIHVAIEHEYIIAYAVNKSALGELYEDFTEEYLQRYKEEDDEGKFFWDTFKRKAGKQYYPITCLDGTVLQYDDDGNPISWLRSRPRFEDDVKKGDIRFVKINGSWSVQFKQRMPKGKTPRSMITDKGTTSTGAKDFYELFRKNIFQNPKPVELIKSLMIFATDDDSTILDFFAGSSTTAHAVMQLNHEDGGTRNFIMIQLPEQCSESSEAFKAGYHDICEIGRERIRRAGENLSGDTGFRVLRVDSSNYRNVYFTPEDLKQDMLDDLIENIKHDRTDLDLLFGTVAELGLTLTQKLSCEKINGFTVYDYGDDDGKKITACFDDNIDAALVEAIARRQPVTALFRDSCFNDSNVMINLKQIFRFYAPESEIKIL